MWHHPPTLRRPGLFVTGTDTGVGKTVATCAIAVALRRAGARPGVCKPFATGCRREREGLVSDDAEALAHFADCRLPLDVINPVRFAAPLAPAVAAEQARRPIDWGAVAQSLTRIDAASDVTLVEGVGGVMVPIDGNMTVLDLARAIGYPAVIVARSALGTLNHTAMTARLLRDAGVRIAGVVMNAYDADSPDVSMASNRRWIARLCDCPVLAVLPRCDEANVRPWDATIDPAILDATATIDWLAHARPTTPQSNVPS